MHLCDQKYIKYCTMEEYYYTTISSLILVNCEHVVLINSLFCIHLNEEQICTTWPHFNKMRELISTKLPKITEQILNS